MQYLLNSSIPAAFLEYLTQAGYRYNRVNNQAGTFTRGSFMVSINFLDLIVREFSDDRSSFMKRDHLFTGIDRLDFLGWVMLLHLTGAVSVSEILAEISAKEIGQLLSVLSSRVKSPAPGVDCPTLSLQEEVNS